MLHWCFICLGLQLIHCLGLFSRPTTQTSILQDLLFACSQCENLIIRYFNVCHPFPDLCNGITYICFNSPIHWTKTLRSIWKPYVQTEVNKRHLFSSVRKCWERAWSASADTVHDDNMPIPTFLVSPGQTQRIPLIVRYLAKQTKRKWVSVTCSHVTKIQKIETSTIWETCKALDTCHEKPFTLSGVPFKCSKMTWIIPLGRLRELRSYRARLSSTHCMFFQLLFPLSSNCKTCPKTQKIFSHSSCAVQLSGVKAWKCNQMASIFVLKQSWQCFLCA